MSHTLLQRFGQTFRCARFVPWRQLGRRAFLVGKRQVVSRMPRRWLLRGSSALSLRDKFPTSLFEKRPKLAEQHRGHWWAVQLGGGIRLTTPVDWRTPRFVPVHQLAEVGDGQGCGRVATHLERLTLHYHEFLHSLPESTAFQVAGDWITQNPPGGNGYWLDRWNSYAISIRCVEWLKWLASLDAGLSEPNSVHEEDRGLARLTLVRSVQQQMNFLCRNLETDISGNHLIKNIRCLLWSSACLKGRDATRWGRLGRKLLAKQLDSQFLSDGMHYELSPAYHCQVLTDLLECAQVLHARERKRLLARLRPSISAMRTLTHADQKISLFSDGGLDMATPPSEILRVWQTLTGEQVLPPAQFYLEAAGYFRFDNRRQSLLVDCGPVCADALPAHGHGDMLSFEWDVDGERFIVDNGVYQYEAGPDRTYDRSSRSHNTVTVGDGDQAEFIGSFRTGWRGCGLRTESHCSNGTWMFAGEHTAFSRADKSIRHRRRFTVMENGLRVEDEVVGDAGSESAVARFLLHDQCLSKQESERKIRISRGASNVTMSADQPLRLRDTTWSPNFGERVSTQRVEATLNPVPGKMTFEFSVES